LFHELNHGGGAEFTHVARYVMVANHRLSLALQAGANTGASHAICPPLIPLENLFQSHNAHSQ